MANSFLAAFLVLLLELVSTTAQVPSGAPRDVAASAVSSQAIRVTWSDVPTDERNGTLQFYQVVYEQAAFPEAPLSGTAEVAADREDELTIENLEEHVEYTVRVRASNEEGYGPFSSPVSVTTYQDVPSSPPQNLLLSSQQPHQLLLTWDRPPAIDINGLLLFYSLRYHRVGYDDFVFDSVDSSSETVVLSRLHSYATYDVFLAASTVNGTGPFARQTGQTIESAPESPPQNFTANSSTPYTIVVEWRPPDESEWNGILRGYRLRYTETVSVESSPEVYTWLEFQISSANQTTFTLHGLRPSTVYCIQIAAVTVESGPYTSPLYIETLEGPTTSGNGSDTINRGGDLENATMPLNETVITRRDSVAAIIAGSVVATVVCLTLVGVAFSLGVVAIRRQRRRKKNFSLAEYFTAPMSGDPLHQQQIHSQGDEVSTGLTFTNPTALSSFELQPNPSYDHPLPSLPPPPSTTTEEPSGELSPRTENEGRTLSSSVMIADNPQYRQFSSQQLHNRSTGGMARVIISAPEVSEGDYDYPATFRVLAHTPENDLYSDTRIISDQSEDPPYATVT